MTENWEGHTRPDLHRTCGHRAWSDVGEWCTEDYPCSICWTHLYGDPDDVREERDRYGLVLDAIREAGPLAVPPAVYRAAVNADAKRMTPEGMEWRTDALSKEAS